MATVRFKNVSQDPIYLTELYVNLDTEDEIEVTRSIGELTAMVGLQGLIHSGAIEQTYLSIPDEEAAYLQAGGEVTSGVNVGTGAGQVFKAMAGFALQFRTVKAGTGVTVTNDAQEVVIANSAPGESNTASNLGTGQGIFAQKTGVDLQFKSIKAGANITLSATGSDVTIAASGGGGSAGIVYIRNIAPQGAGVVSSKVFEDSPTNSILSSCTSSTNAITVTVAASYPKIKVNGTSATLPLVDGDYAGDVNITVSGSGDVVAEIDVTEGATYSTALTVDSPPELLTLQFTGNYPGSQTELKAGDSFQLTGTTDKAATGIEILDYGACTLQTFTFASNTSFTVTAIIADRGITLQALPARVRARSATGAYGGTRDTNTGGGSTDKVHLVNLNNLYPTVTFGAVTYPFGQSALKGGESGSVAVTLANLDTVAFTSPGSELSITDPTTIAPSKDFSRIGGTYNVSVNNLRAQATRAANNAQTTGETIVNIANVAATISVSTPAARLRSGGNNETSVQNHTITINSTQRLYAAPSMDAGAGGGTFTGSWVGGPTSYTRTLQVHDDNVKGSYSYRNLSAVNLAGIETTTISSGSAYVLGGFVARNLTFAAYRQQTALNVAVVDYSKLIAGIFTATSQAATRTSAQGDHGDYVNKFTVDALNTNPTTIWWNDLAASRTNSSGTAQITNVEETV